MFTFGAEGSTDPNFLAPCAVAVDKTGIYVADSVRSRLQKFSLSGNYKFGWGRPGHGDSEFLDLAGLGVDQQGNIFATDWQLLVKLFAIDGSYMSGLGSLGSGEGQFSRCNAICKTTAGLLYVVDRGNNRIQIWESDGTPKIESLWSLQIGPVS